MLLITLPVLWIGLRVGTQFEQEQGLNPGTKYTVSYEFLLKGLEGFKVKSFLPVQNHRQRVTLNEAASDQPGQVLIDGENKRATWMGEVEGFKKISYQFEVVGQPVRYAIPQDMAYAPVLDNGDPYLASTEVIQADSPEIRALAVSLTEGSKTMGDMVSAIYDVVMAIPSNSNGDVTDALSALHDYEASCNGKTRLFVALCRSLKIPSRMVGGLVMENTRKKTSHAWAEVLMGDSWVPFDALNGHFASLPAHYLELYKGDEFLITRNPEISFDYAYDIRESRLNSYADYALLDLWQIIDEAGISEALLKALMLLPLGALLVAISRNIIGFKTFGVFLPVLVALSLLETGMVPGLILLTSIVLVVALLNYPLEWWGVQYTSKIAMMLIAVVIVSLLAMKFLLATQWLSAASPLFFPIIILTVISERFAKKIDEEDLKSALGLYVQTMAVTVFIFFILSSTLIQNFLITFPEVIISLAGINLLLGKWIGIRITEYKRFYALLNA